MIELKLLMDGDNIWPDLSKGYKKAVGIQIARLKGGMASGASSVTIRFDMPDGSIVLGQTTMKLFLAAARAFEGKENAP
jgi:hypothetical protein